MAEGKNLYEVVIVTSAKLGEEGSAELVNKFKALIAEHGTVESVDDWGKRRFAYPIAKQTEGYYTLINFESGPEFTAELDRRLGITDGISFRNPDSEYEAQTLTFTERQADAILAMPLSRLVGLELMKLHQENETLLANIAEYEDILGSITKLHKVIKKRLTTYKKQFGRPRRTELCNLTMTNYVEEVKEEDIYVLIDRFGYAKSMDSAAYGRLAPETLQEIPHTVMMKNTDKLCVFTDQGNMYQIKAKDIPKGKARDKGILIHNLCKMNNEENGLLMISFEELFNSQLLFITKKGYVKQVSGIEFETSRYMVSASKLDADDLLVAVEQVMPEDAIFGDRKVIMITKKGMSLGFPLAEVNEFKKTSRGLKGIALADNDEVLYGALVQPDTDIKVFDGKKYNVKTLACLCSCNCYRIGPSAGVFSNYYHAGSR